MRDFIEEEIEKVAKKFYFIKKISSIGTLARGNVTIFTNPQLIMQDIFFFNSIRLIFEKN